MELESAIHRAVVANLKQRAAAGVVWFHVPNGGLRNKRTAAILSGMGTRPGVSDLLLFHKGQAFALELKAEKGRTSEAQEQFLFDWENAGGLGFVAQGLDEAITILETAGLLTGKAQ